jgi:hypothetical protein
MSRKQEKAPPKKLRTVKLKGAIVIPRKRVIKPVLKQLKPRP